MTELVRRELVSVLNIVIHETDNWYFTQQRLASMNFLMHFDDWHIRFFVCSLLRSGLRLGCGHHSSLFGYPVAALT